MKKLMILATLALLAAPVASTSGTMVFAEDNADATSSSSSEETVDDYIENLKNFETKAQLYYKYTKSVENGITNYDISNIGIRFGGIVGDKTFAYFWQRLESKTESSLTYGITCSTVSWKDKGYISFVNALNSGKAYTVQSGDESHNLANSEAVYYENSAITNGWPSWPTSYKDADGNYYKDEIEGYYYIFNIFINVSNNSLDKTIYAAASLALSEEGTIYFKETAYSVESIAKAYIADTKTFANYSTDVQNTLNLLSQGYTSGKVTDTTTTK